MSSPDSKSPLVYHLIPTNQYGGVEVAAKLSFSQLNRSIDYNLIFLNYKQSDSISFLHHYSLWDFFLKALNGNRLILIVSLWPSYFASLLFVLFPNIHVIPFYHNSKFVHWRDKFFSLLVLFQSKYCFVDSNKTNTFISSHRKIKSFVIPYEFPFPKSITPKPFSCRKFDLIFIGRFTSQKRFDLVRPFLSSLSRCFSHKLSIAMVLASSPLGDVSSFRDQLASLANITVSYSFNITNVEVLQLLTNSKAFVLLSDYEGYSMTLSEAIRAGCICMVRDLHNYSTNFATSNQTFNLDYSSGCFSDSDLIPLVSYLTNRTLPPVFRTSFEEVSYVSSLCNALLSI